MSTSPKYCLAIEMGPGGVPRYMRSDRGDAVIPLPGATPILTDLSHDRLVATLEPMRGKLQDVRLIGYDCPRPTGGKADYLSFVERWWSDNAPDDASEQLGVPIDLFTDREALCAYLLKQYGLLREEQYGLIIVNDSDSGRGGAVRHYLLGKEPLRLHSKDLEEDYSRWVYLNGKLSTAAEKLRTEVLMLRRGYPEIPRIFLWSPSGIVEHEGGDYWQQPPEPNSPACQVTVVTDPYAALRGALLLAM